MTLRALLPRGASWRLALARALAWSLLIGGWIGIAALAERLTAGPLAAAAVVALWLLATGFASEALGRVRWPVGGLRAGMLLAAGLAAWAGRASLQGGGTPTLVVLALASACVLALASTTVRALRPSPAVAAPASPVGAATVGAVLAWAAVGDPSDLLAMADRLAVLLVLAAAVLAALRPRAGGAGRASARPGCRAGLFDCAMPAWPPGAWRHPAHWPPSLAALVMLPMMWGLPQMLALCRGTAVPATAVLALHLAAMFAPAWLLGRCGASGLGPDRLSGLCAWLLVAGAAAALADGPFAGECLALAHGAAWSLAWAMRLSPPDPTPRLPLPAPWRAAAGSAGFVLLLGAWQHQVGPAALSTVHVLLGLLAAVALGWGAGRRPVHVVLAGLPPRG